MNHPKDMRCRKNSLHRAQQTLILVIVFLVHASVPSARAQVANESDSLALVSIYQALNGPQWNNNANWLSGPVQSWDRVTLMNGRVTELHLSNNNLVGGIPAEIGDLPELLELNISGNHFTGSIPAEIGNLTNLMFLWASFSELTGSIPAQIGNLSSLIDLDLSSNLMSGPLPESMGNLPLLEDLYLYNNKREGNSGFSGAIPSSFGNLSSLRNFEAEINSLSGSIPSQLGSLPNLIDLFLADNDLSGAVPLEFANLPSLEILNLGDNLLDEFPDLSDLTTVLGLFLSGNQFTFEDFEPNVAVAQNIAILFPQDSVNVSVNGSGQLSVIVGGENNEYQWYKGFSPVSGATSSTFTPTEEGTYFCWITNTVVAGSLVSKKIQSGPSTSIVVNETTDESDHNIGDEVCDVDAGLPGNQCTLRAAIQTANATSAPAYVSFNIAGSGIPVISPTSALPSLTSEMELDGTTQAAQHVEIDGTNAGLSDGLHLAASGITIRGLMVNNFELYGLRINAGDDHAVVNNVIGANLLGDELRLNAFGGILVDAGATGSTIGGFEESQENIIGGGVRILGSETSGIKLLRNTIKMPIELLVDDLRVPVDLGNDGPTCTSWAPKNVAAPNKNMAPARITDLDTGHIAGLTRPNATIVVFTVEAKGTGRGRYFARSVEPVATGTADANGVFDIPISVADGSEVTTIAIDSDGNSSELSQLRRPAIYLPGVGGSWLEAADGTNLWIPTSLFDETINNNLARLAMDPTGKHGIEQVNVDGIVEFGGYGVYGEILAHLNSSGYIGKDENTNPEILDLWRFPYDWRRDVNEPVVDLIALIDRLVGGGQDVARSCEVDLVTHSNGGMVANVYVRKNVEHSQNNVHRLITSGAPYLGSTQVAAAHTVGYVFGIEESLLSDLQWGRMTEMFRNLPGAYGLMPSRKYWDAVNPTSDGHLPFYLADLDGNDLLSYDETFDFLTSAKVGTDGEPLGMGRNRSLWEQQQTEVHEVMDDWRDWNGPPQIFRMVGDLNLKTATSWMYDPVGAATTPTSTRVETGDTDRHVQYREGLFPLPGWGDGTVPLASATLGHDQRVGSTDFSGVGSPWIEGFEFYPCLHVALVTEACMNGGVNALVRTEHILKSGYQAMTAPSSTDAMTDSDGEQILTTQELFFVRSSAPVAVSILDTSGNQSGPVSLDSLGVIEFEVPNIGYWASKLSTVISAPSSEDYTIRILSGGDESTVRVTRQLAMGNDRTNIFFDDILLPGDGSMQMHLSTIGTNSSLNFEVDIDGDGSFESTLSPSGEFDSSYPAPAIPRPAPFVLTEDMSTTETPRDIDITFPDVGGGTWSWSLENLPAWIDASSTSGQVPSTVTLTIDQTALSIGNYNAQLSADVTLGTYTVTYPIDVNLVLRDQAGSLSSIVVTPETVLMPVGSTQSFTALGYDQSGLAFGFNPNWGTTGGSIDSEGNLYAGDEPGNYVVTATDSSSGLNATANVEVFGIPVSVDDAIIPAHYGLFSNFPNPFRGTTSVAYALPEQAQVKITVFDMLGRTVAVLVDAIKAPGVHYVQFDASNLSSGLYLYHLEAGSYHQTQTMIRMK